MKEALESEEGFFPADAEASIVLKPGNSALYCPAAAVTAQRPSVLSDGSVSSVGCDHFDSLLEKRFIETITIVSFVSNDPLRQLPGQHETEEFLDEPAFRVVGRSGVDCHRQSLRIDQNHDFDALSHPRAADPVPAALGLGKGSVHKTLVEPVTALLLGHLSNRPHDLLEDARLHPAQEPAVHTAFGAEFFGQVFPLGSVVENPKDSGNGLPFIRRRPSALRTGFKVGNQTFEEIEFVIAKCKHRSILASHPSNARFWDSL